MAPARSPAARVVLAALFAALGASCGEVAPAPAGPSVLLVTVDTLRADRLGCYGYPRGTSAAIDALAERAVVFDDAQAQASWTLPSFASLLTSLSSSAHGCFDFESSLAPSFETLAERLLAAGWDTAAVVSHVFLGRPYGLHQGFVHFDEELVLALLQSDEEISSPAVSAKGIEFLRQRAASPDRRPFFLWLHYFDPHVVYQRHAGVSEAFGVASDGDLYDGEVAFVDHHVGFVLAALEELDLARDTLVVLTADHGEELGDHGGRDHGHTLYRELVHVPLIVRASGFAPRRVATTVRSLDVSPTVLELCGLDPPAPSEGRSLVPALRGLALAGEPAVAELRRKAANDLASLVDGRYKLVVDRSRGRVALFDREADPRETRDLAAERPELVERLRARLESLCAAARALGVGRAGGVAPSLGVEERERLGELGYTRDE